MTQTKEQRKINDAANKKRRYHSLINITGDVQWSRDNRGKSDATIKEMYGIIVDQELQPIKEKSYSSYQRAKVSITRSVTNYKKRTPKEKRKKIVMFTKEKDYPLWKPWKRKRRKTRKELWSDWSINRDDLMPHDVRKAANKLNLDMGFTKDRNYGFAVVYEAFINNQSIELWSQRIKPDIGYDGDLYATVSGASKM